MALYVPAGNVGRKARTRASHPSKMDYPITRPNVGPNVLAAKNRGQRAVAGRKVSGGAKVRGGAFG